MVVILLNTNNKNSFFTLYSQVKNKKIDLDKLDSDTIHQLLLLAEEEYKLRKVYNDKKIDKLLYKLQELKKSLNNI